MGVQANIGDALEINVWDAIANHKAAKSVVQPANDSSVSNHQVMLKMAISGNSELSPPQFDKDKDENSVSGEKG